MAINSNDELRKAVNEAIKESGVKKTHIAKELRVSRQQVSNLLVKQNFAIDDANKLLNIIGLCIDDVSIKKI